MENSAKTPSKTSAKIKFTKRESQCIVLLMRGKTNRQVADTLTLSPNTVGFYINNIKQKTGLSKQLLLIELKKDQFKEKYQLEPVQNLLD
jgi:DNA-binding CsgD family transcriptional regulator